MASGRFGIGKRALDNLKSVAGHRTPWIQPRYGVHLLVVLLVLASTLAARSNPGFFAYTPRELSPQPIVLPPVDVLPEAEPAPEIFSPAATRWPAALGRAGRTEELEALLPRDSSAAAKAAPATQAAQAAPQPRLPFKYTVAPGDTLSGIADKYGISTETIIWANNQWDPGSLQIGEELVILPVSGILHTVTDGDNVHDLAMAYDVTAEAIAEFNGLADPNMLRVGDKLVVPGGKMQVARASPVGRSTRPSPTASGSFRWPVGGNITQYFGEAGHSGIDLATGHGSPVYAADGGVVVTALKLGYGYGWHLVIDHGNGYQTLYSHLSAFYADYGERVAKGDRIGAVGSTGLSTGPHLHFEVLQGGARVNPLKFLP